MARLEELPARMDALTSRVLLLRDEIRVAEENICRTLRDEIRAGDEETRRQMRVLHEDIVGRLTLIQEGANGRRVPRGKNRKR